MSGEWMKEFRRSASEKLRSPSAGSALTSATESLTRSIKQSFHAGWSFVLLVLQPAVGLYSCVLFFWSCQGPGKQQREKFDAEKLPLSLPQVTHTHRHMQANTSYESYIYKHKWSFQLFLNHYLLPTTYYLLPTTYYLLNPIHRCLFFFSLLHHLWPRHFLLAISTCYFFICLVRTVVSSMTLESAWHSVWMQLQLLLQESCKLMQANPIECIFFSLFTFASFRQFSSI